MTTSMHSTPHLDDAELARLLDNEHSPDEAERWDAHVAACAHCQGEIDRLRADAGVVRVWLERAAFEEAPPHDAVRPGMRRSPSTPWLRAAAVSALIALPVTAIAAIPTLRAWVVAAIAELRAGDDAATTMSQRAPNATIGDRIRFVPAAGSFAVQLDAEQEVGTLRVAHGTDTLAVLDRDGTPTVVSESTLRIRNTAASARSYVLQLPLTVTSVTVRIGARTIAELDTSALRTGTELPLRAR
jgi:anti-sigma factor RsiW